MIGVVPRRCARWRRWSGVARAAMALLAMTAAFGAVLDAYQILGYRVGGRVVTLEWPRLPVRYFVTDRAAGGVSASALQGAVSRAFSTWQGVATSKAAAEFVGYTGASPFEDDGAVTLGFLSRPDLDRVLGATDFLIDKVTGEIVESDIFFNSTFPWSTAASGEPGRYDLESVALHEIGHLFGLGHSALGETELLASGGRRVIATEAAMFPIAFSAGSVSGRVLRADDIAGISSLYPDGAFSSATGSLSGRVTRDGQGVYGAHVVAFNPATRKLIAGFTADGDGRFVIAGLDPGLHVIRVEPVDDANLDSFFEDPDTVETRFAVTYFERYVAVPRGGDSGSVEVRVTATSGSPPSSPVTPVPVVDPTTVEFVASADHDAYTSGGAPMVEAYQLEISRRGDAVPWLVVPLGRPAPGDGRLVRLPLAGVVPGWPLPTGIYEARVAALGPTGVGRSAPSNPFSPVRIVEQTAPGEPRRLAAVTFGEPRDAPAGAAIGLRVGLGVGGGESGWTDVDSRGADAQKPRPAVAPPRKPAAVARPVGPSGRWPGRPGSFEAVASMFWSAASSLGTSVAGLTGNGSDSSLPWFRTAASVDQGIGVEGRLAYRVTRAIAVETGFTWTRPAIGLSIADDFEGAPAFDGVGERMHQVSIDGGLLVQPARLAAVGGRVRPFVSAGGGYLRQLHENRTLVETGASWRVGGGADVRLGSRPVGLVSSVSLRVEGGVRGTIGGLAFDRNARAFGAFGAGLLLHF